MSLHKTHGLKISLLALCLMLCCGVGWCRAEIYLFYFDPEDQQTTNNTSLVASIRERTQRSQFTQPLLAIKSNLLYDAMSIINLEAEIPIYDRWSVLGEIIFPWWTMNNREVDSRRNRFQLFNGTLEGRYWWGDREELPLLTGWFTGLYVGGGLYDFEYRGKGYQGEFFVAAGVSGGYSHLIGHSDRLRIEYSLGVGYLSSNYDYYEACFCCSDSWHAVRERSGRYSWFGPTRAKVSLSWMINRRR